MDIERGSEASPLLEDTTGAKKTSAINLQSWLYPHTHLNFEASRESVRHHLTSKVGHYFILGLVILDVSAIFAGES